MNLGQIRLDLAAVGEAAGFNAWSYQPDDVQDLPAAVVGGMREFERMNRLVTRLMLTVTLYCSLANPQDATARLDQALSTGDPDSFITLLDNATGSWTSIRFASAGPYTRYAMPGGEAALGTELTLELTG